MGIAFDFSPHLKYNKRGFQLFLRVYKLRTTLAVSVGIWFVMSAIASAGQGRLKNSQANRGIAVDSSGTQSIIVEVGNGSGPEEEILYETLTYIPHSEDFYSVYIGFFGVYFDEYSGEVHQSRYTDRSYNVDGELIASSTDTMDYEMTLSNGFRVASGRMLDPIPATDDTLSILQTSYLRVDTEDCFIILEYTLFNNSNDTLSGGEVLFFCDFDVGDAIYDNFTGRDTSLNLVFQFSDDDDYAGLALIIPDSLTYQFGNYSDWFFDGTDAVIDTFIAHAFHSDTDTVIALYDTTRENTMGDHSSFLVTQIGDILPWEERIIVYALAIQTDLPSLQAQIDIARAQYSDNLQFMGVDPVNKAPVNFDLITVYPNPFNSSTTINLELNTGGEGWIRIYNNLGRLIETIHQGCLNKGNHLFRWNAGETVSAGIYFIQAEYSGNKSISKILYLK